MTQRWGQGVPLRPAVIDADGSNLRSLDAVSDPDLNLGCGDVSPDGTRIALEGFGDGGDPALDGIYSVRASDGGGLVRLVQGPVSPPRYSPDGTRLSFFDTTGRGQPHGIGSPVRDAGRRQRPPSHHAVGVRLRRPRVVPRRNLDRVPEAVRTALSGAPRWLRAPPGPDPAPVGVRAD